MEGVITTPVKPQLYTVKGDHVLPQEQAFNLGIMCYMNMCGYEFENVETKNAEFMAHDQPTLIVPGNLVISGCWPLIKFVKGTLSGFSIPENRLPVNVNLSENDKVKGKYIIEILKNIIIYMSWFQSSTHYKSTAEKYGGRLTWALRSILTYSKYRTVLDYFKSIEWDSKTPTEVMQILTDTLGNIAFILGKGPYLFEQKKPSEIDAFIGAFLIIINAFFDGKLLNNFPDIQKFVNRVCAKEEIRDLGTPVISEPQESLAPPMFNLKRLSTPQMEVTTERLEYNIMRQRLQSNEKALNLK